MTATVVIVGSTDNSVYAYNKATGATAWSYATGSNIYYSSPLIRDGFAYIGSNDKKLYRLNVDTGALSWATAATGN